MARRSNRTDSATAVAEVTPEVQEDTVSTATEATEASTEPEAPEAEAPKAEVVYDLSAFTTAAEAAVEERDTATGELAVALFAPVQTAFRELDGTKARNAAKHYLNEAMKDSMNGLDMPKARAYMLLADSLTTAGAGTKAERVPSDPTEAFIQRIVGLRLASKLAVATVPEGVKEGWQEKANELFTSSEAAATEYKAWMDNEAEDKGDEPEVASVVKSAVKLASGKSAKVGGSTKTGSTFDGPRRDIAKHIHEAFAGEPTGTFLTIAQIRAHVSEEYGLNPPSAGAISARLFPSSGGPCTVTGVQPGTNEKSNKGASKL